MFVPHLDMVDVVVMVETVVMGDMVVMADQNFALEIFFVTEQN